MNVQFDFSGRHVMVFGGTTGINLGIAQHYAMAGARVSVVSRALTPVLAARKAAGKLEHVDRDYESGALDGAFLVIGATDRGDVNERISKDAMERGLLVNIVDDPDRCNFILPSLVRQGDLSIAVSTGGKT